MWRPNCKSTRWDKGNRCILDIDEDKRSIELGNCAFINICSMSYGIFSYRFKIHIQDLLQIHTLPKNVSSCQRKDSDLGRNIWIKAIYLWHTWSVCCNFSSMCRCGIGGSQGCRTALACSMSRGGVVGADSSTGCHGWGLTHGSWREELMCLYWQQLFDVLEKKKLWYHHPVYLYMCTNMV